jgi:hypothetical protein
MIDFDFDFERLPISFRLVLCYFISEISFSNVFLTGACRFYDRDPKDYFYFFETSGMGFDNVMKGRLKLKGAPPKGGIAFELNRVVSKSTERNPQKEQRLPLRPKWMSPKLKESLSGMPTREQRHRRNSKLHRSALYGTLCSVTIQIEKQAKKVAQKSHRQRIEV